MSESLHAGYLPLWNPYINFGIPQYGDMNAGYWSPVTWAIASTIGYNAYTFTLELLGYILLSGIGMYKLSGYWISNRHIRIMMGIAYMCCGFHVAHLQHFNWISGSAFLPWCTWSYILLLRQKTTSWILLSSILFYLFAASAHPGMIIGGLYFFLAILIFVFCKNDEQLPFVSRLKRLSFTHLFLIPALLLLSAGIITGYADIIPHFVRGEKIELSESLPHSSNFKTWISFILPFSTVKNASLFETDLTLRNSYFSISLLLLFIVALVGKKTSWQNFFLAVGLAFILLSAGGLAKTFGHHYLPFIGYVRLNGEFRIFAILSFIIVAGIELEKILIRPSIITMKKVKWVTIILLSTLVALMAWAIMMIASREQSILFNLQDISSIGSFSEKAKYAIDAISFYDTIWTQGLLQVILLILIFRALKNKKMAALKMWLIADVILSSLLNIPYTGVGKDSVAHLQSVLDRSPKGIPIPPLVPIRENDTIAPADNALLGEWNMYNKQPGTTRELPYPIQLKNMRAYFDGQQDHSIPNYNDKPFIFAQNGNAVVQLLSFSPNRIVISAHADSLTNLVLQQNHYPFWEYASDGKTSDVLNAGTNFMAAPLKKGNNKISFTFKPVAVKYSLCLSALVLLAYLISLLILHRKKL